MNKDPFETEFEEMFSGYEPTDESLDDGQQVLKNKKTGKKESEGNIMLENFLKGIGGLK